MKKLISGFLSLALLMLAAPRLFAQDAGLYGFDKKIAVPGDGGWDYLSIDNINHHLFVSHGNSVKVIDLNTESVIGSIDNLKGVHGIAVANELNRGFISDGRGDAVIVFNLQTLDTIATIHIDGKNPDAIAYDPYTKRVFTFNGRSGNSTVIDAATLNILGTIDLGGKPEFAVADGKGKIFNNLEDKSSLNVIDTKSMKVIANYPLAPCVGPSGLAIDPKNERLFTACDDSHTLSVVDGNTGKIITSLPIGDGVDADRYDPSTRLIFSSNGEGDVTIIKQESANSYKIVQTLKTQARARTIEVDPRTHKIYLSVGDFVQGTRKMVPGSFAVLVYKMK